MVEYIIFTNENKKDKQHKRPKADMFAARNNKILLMILHQREDMNAATPKDRKRRPKMELEKHDDV